MNIFRYGRCLEYATVGYMAKRIQMRKQRYMAIQKIQQAKQMQMQDGGQQQPGMGMPGGGGGGDHSHSHGHGHSHSHPHASKQTVSSRTPGYSNIQQNVGSRGCSVVGPLFQEVRFKVHDPKAHSKGGTLENTINGGRGRGGGDSGPDEESGGDMRTSIAPPLMPPPDKVSVALIKYICYITFFY